MPMAIAATAATALSVISVRRRWRRSDRSRSFGRRTACRTAEDGLTGFESELLAPLRDLALELLVGEEDRLHQVNHHVVDGTMTRPGPVARVRNVSVGRRGVEVSDDVEDRSLRQDRRHII